MAEDIIHAEIMGILMKHPFQFSGKQVYMWNSDAKPVADKIMSMLAAQSNKHLDKSSEGDDIKEAFRAGLNYGHLCAVKQINMHNEFENIYGQAAKEFHANISTQNSDGGK